MSKIETTSKVSLKLPSWKNLGRRGACAELSILDTAHKPPPQSEKGYPQAGNDPQLPQEPLITPLGPQKQQQMAIIDYAQNRNYKQSATKPSEQEKPRKVRHGCRAPDPGHSPQAPHPHSPERA